MRIKIKGINDYIEGNLEFDSEDVLIGARESITGYFYPISSFSPEIGDINIGENSGGNSSGNSLNVSRRDLAAMLAMNGILSNRLRVDSIYSKLEETTAKMAVKYADELIKQLN